jgi:hypothetical protein
MSSFFDSIAKFGGDALDSLGEGLETFVQSSAQKAHEEKASNPDSFTQQSTVQQGNGQPVTQGGAVTTISNDTLLIVGGVLLLTLLGFVVLKGSK